MHRTDCARIFGHPSCRCAVVLPEASGGYVAKRSSTPLWERVRDRARVLFQTERTSHEMALVFAALQDADNRVEACEERIQQLSDTLKQERKERKEADETLSAAMAVNGI